MSPITLAILSTMMHFSDPALAGDSREAGAFRCEAGENTQCISQLLIRTARNIRTGERVKVKPTTRPAFKQQKKQ
jgi:hypothetical protein